jgi:hypothetical protein
MKIFDRARYADTVSTVALSSLPFNGGVKIFSCVAVNVSFGIGENETVAFNPTFSVNVCIWLDSWIGRKFAPAKV